MQELCLSIHVSLSLVFLSPIGSDEGLVIREHSGLTLEEVREEVLLLRGSKSVGGGVCVVWSGDEIGLVLAEEFGSEDVVEENVESWYAFGRKVRVFYDLGFESEEMWELMGRNRSLFMECSEEALVNKTDYFCRFGIGKEEAALLILRNPDNIAAGKQEEGTLITRQTRILEGEHFTDAVGSPFSISAEVLTKDYDP
ncbi:unnamed protein product [Brassica oleracea]|uniref:Uncharacterized protein n=1 Tax=Brassica oleracea TaxID=3712 RepID=A0A3P6E7M5_BRAOL|nr:unnamed protein product [Brassica oleracea]